MSTSAAGGPARPLQMFVAGAEQPAVQYGRWISRAAHGDFGRSIMLRRGDLYRRGSVAP